MNDYFYVEQFAKTYPDRVNKLNDVAFTVLLLESNNPCHCTSPLCEKPHQRIWRSNLRTIDLLKKCHLIREFRVIAHDVNPKMLDLNPALTELAGSLGEPLTAMRKILFLGEGLVEVGSGALKASIVDAEAAAKLIHTLFPNVSDLTNHLQRKWGISHGYTKLPPDACILFEQTFMKYVHQLEALQLHLTTPLELHKFCEDLTSLSINIQHIRWWAKLPPIPARRLRILYLLRIDAAIPWNIFELTQGQLAFQSLEKADFEFVVNAKDKIAFPGYQYPVVFPVLNSMRITNAMGVYSDIYAHFISNVFSKLVVIDDPSTFEHIDWRVLQNSQQFELDHPTGEFYKRRYSSDTILNMFSQESTVRNVVMLGPVYYALPRIINWHDLVSLDLAVAIANNGMLCNMVAQLPQLESLHIKCVSMDANVACNTVYPDEVNIPEGPRVITKKSYANENPFQVLSWNLRLFDLYSDQAFDADGFCQLLCRLPRVESCAINGTQATKVNRLLTRHYQLRRHIHIYSYYVPIDFLQY